ncbi:glycoside hydrolase family 127 protein [Streptomyces sp. TRM S81-3]|uniref:Glycoside hydrolase family 127 protein n=1 Tax=Streptomyces griseicoloratus TaxID=2752516 RepID=A0A926L680_9ACTN|nr:beta-L-arabinofuranosidase domain-containing protein [Streptomyces griseicoloratus]MBD0421819.1 glycoside hydrolase family 127 protein [Streptomyces griseicoloratus]
MTEQSPLSRRRLLATTTALAAAPALTALPLAGPARAAAASAAASSAAPAGSLPAPATWNAHPFPLNAVELGAGVFRDKRDLMLAYARAYPADRILAVFRANAGLDTRGAQAPGGWETEDGNLRGHYAGHFLTLIAQAYASTGDAFFRDKLDDLVTGLGECQAALAASGAGSHPGFLAAYPETQFELLEQYTTYPTIWAPYYTCHKIMRGLLDAHTLAGSAQALTIVTGMGDWVHSRLSRLPREQLDRMWSIYIAGEYGGMNEVMADLHALTGKPEYLTTARCFDNTQLLKDCADGRDTLDGKHANQHIPQFSGYLRIHDQDPRAEASPYREAAENFWHMVTGHHTYALGGTGQGEMFRARDAIAATLADNNAETCATYNMLKLTRYLFLHEPDAAYMDFYERGLYNHILGSRQDTHSTRSPLVTYFVGQGPGTRREFGNTGTCCGGTGMENHTKYQESVYFRSADARALYVNLYLASTLHWRERGLTVTQETRYPYEGSSRITIGGRGGRFDLRLRVPSWAGDGFTVEVNGSRRGGVARPGTYLSLRRTWSPGDVVDVTLPLRLRVEQAPDDPDVQSLFHGPVLLAAHSGERELREVSLYSRLPLGGDLSAVVRPANEPLHFTLDGTTLAPFHLGDTTPYHAYFRRSEPEIVFRGERTGVPNRRTAGGRTFLDALWARSPFASHGELVRAVRRLSGQWLAEGLLSRAEREEVVAAAERARFD